MKILSWSAESFNPPASSIYSSTLRSGSNPIEVAFKTSPTIDTKFGLLEYVVHLCLLQVCCQSDLSSS